LREIEFWIVSLLIPSFKNVQVMCWYVSQCAAQIPYWPLRNRSLKLGG